MAKLTEHSHCLYCGDPTVHGDDYCDPECEMLHDYDRKAEKRKDDGFYIFVAVSLVGVLAVGTLIRILL